MRTLWVFLYNIFFVPLLWTSVHFASFFIHKIRKGIAGRKHLFEQLEREMPHLTAPRRVWLHSSSMGEFEQAKPIIAALKEQYGNIDIVVTFFSPSGYEHSRSYKQASLISYIPFDTARNARRFVELVKPDAVVLMRYDVWPNHLWELRRHGIPVIIANATARKGSTRFWFALRNFHRYLYNDLTAILTVSETDAEAFRSFRLSQTDIRAIGETRYDQVWKRSLEARSKHYIPSQILKRKKVFTVGSSWEEDEEILLPVFRAIAERDSSALFILVPHEPTLETLERLETTLNGTLRSIRFSALNDYSNENVILVDSIGILMGLYQYADAAYVGGSFKQGIHNVLEPAAYGIPVLYGPKHKNSQEAIELARRGGGFVITNKNECYAQVRKLFTNQKTRKAAGAIALNLVKENIGATERCVEQLAKVLQKK